jgi:hypothetical protein
MHAGSWKNRRGGTLLASLEPGSMETKSRRVPPQPGRGGYLAPAEPGPKHIPRLPNARIRYELGQAGPYAGYQSHPYCLSSGLCLPACSSLSPSSSSIVALFSFPNRGANSGTVATVLATFVFYAKNCLKID